MEKAKFAKEYAPSYQPRIGLWLAMRWPFGSKKTLDKIFYAFTLGVSSPNTLEDGAWKMGKVYGFHALVSGSVLYLAWKLFADVQTVITILKLLLIWPIFMITAACFQLSSAPYNKRPYTKARNIWIWGRGLEYMALVSSIGFVVFMFLALPQ
ncbi:hypothetical protein V5R04_10155 [Jonesiaceae bacterium BS-20]|uniref:Uncharacterized protein n=1 Tax=Jonesiaceae bacterium BS-20 TaxID=3120821 RepID=A0AAU7DV03_9MICO